tara:strand:+ start:53 stop:496 length:444 start_codon:yes stop_codon:yes gene_type:complete
MKKLITSLIISFFFCLPAISKDLSGNALECFGENNIAKELVAIQFISKKKVRYSYVALEGNSVFRLIKNKEFKYNVTEETIYIKSKSQSKVYPEFKVDVEINRTDLSLTFPHMTAPKCRLIDINSYDPFKEIDKYQIQEEPKKEKKL